MEQTKCKIIPFRPAQAQARDSRTYQESDVKKILYAFARDLGCRWRAGKLRKFIDTAFNFD